MKKITLLIVFLGYLSSGLAQTTQPLGSLDSDTSESEAVRVYTLKEIRRMAADTSQSGKRRNFITFHMGMSMATGRFGQNENRSRGDGFAQNGLALGFEYAGFWNKNIGFGFTTGTFTNRLDERQLPKFFQPIRINDNDPTIVEQEFFNVKRWRSYYIFTGPYVSVPLKNLFLDFKCLGGFLLNRHPGFETEQDNIPNGIRFSVQPRSNVAFGINAGTAVRLKLSEGTQMRVGVDYVHSQVKTSYTVDNRTGPQVDAGRQKVSAFNLSWGLAFSVGKQG